MAIFNSYVSLPEGTVHENVLITQFFFSSKKNLSLQGSRGFAFRPSKTSGFQLKKHCSEIASSSPPTFLGAARNDGKTMGKPWKNHGKTMGKLQKSLNRSRLAARTLGSSIILDYHSNRGIASPQRVLHLFFNPVPWRSKMIYLLSFGPD